MRFVTVSAMLAGFVAIAACDGAKTGVSASASRAPVPSAVSCADGSHLRQRAVADRREKDETRSDQERIVAGTRATFFTSLATIADLKCKVTLAEADEALNPALDAARMAEAAESFYERAALWGEASDTAAQVVQVLTKQLDSAK